MAFELFDGSDQDEAAEDLQINRDFARRFEHNKKREALQRLEELKKKGLAGSESESDESNDDGDEDLEDIAGTGKADLQFYDTLLKVKSKDPVIQQKDAKLYSSSDEDEGAGKTGDDKKKKKPGVEKGRPLYLKDVTAQQLLEHGAELGEEPAKQRELQSKIYSKEQEENLKAFLEAADEAMGDDSDGEDLLVEKKRGEDESEDSGEVEIKKKVDEYWGEDEVLDENERFLKNFFVKKMWVDKERGQVKPFGDEDLLDLDEDELDKQEEFEAKYNFRHEEEAGDRVLGHSRFIEGSVRKKKNARKAQRKSKEERTAQAEQERREELKHLKNLKKKEIKEKLDKIRVIAGVSEDVSLKFKEEDLEEDFDPEEFDKKMQEAFGDEYYGNEDADPGFRSCGEDDLEKIEFDELLGLPKSLDLTGTGEGFKAARERSLKSKVEEEGGGKMGDEEEYDEEDSSPYDSKRKKKRKIALKDKVQIEKELEEYYKLDYEDTVGDLKTRFKYKSVPSNRYGLNAAEILMTDDKELNQYVSLRKIAPYREEEWKVPEKKRYHMKMKVLGQDKSENDKISKKHPSKHSDSKKSEKMQKALSNGEALTEDNISRKSKRRRRQAELKLSQSRLAAYGMVSSEPKKKKKKENNNFSLNKEAEKH